MLNARKILLLLTLFMSGVLKTVSNLGQNLRACAAGDSQVPGDLMIPQAGAPRLYPLGVGRVKERGFLVRYALQA